MYGGSEGGFLLQPCGYLFFWLQAPEVFSQGLILWLSLTSQTHGSAVGNSPKFQESFSYLGTQVCSVNTYLTLVFLEFISIFQLPIFIKFQHPLAPPPATYHPRLPSPHTSRWGPGPWAQVLTHGGMCPQPDTNVPLLSGICAITVSFN